LLSILQVDEMVWPGSGSEVVFEIYKSNTANKEERFVRILWGGVVLHSSYPVLGNLDMLSLNTILDYFDALVGVGARKVPGMCAAPIDFESGMGLGTSKGLDFCVDC
jgi:acid phosphatase